MAKKMMDIRLQADGELHYKSTEEGGTGDFEPEESTRQHQRQLIINNKGDFKENPNICVGVDWYMNEDDGMQALMQEIAAQFANDGMDVQGVRLNEKGEIISNAEYK